MNALAADIPKTGPSAFRDLLAALRPAEAKRILDVGAGGFRGDVTTKYLLELFPEAQLTAIELDEQRAEAVRERFGDRVRVVTGDIRTAELTGPFDLVAIDLDSGGIPMVYEELLDGRIAALTRPGATIVAHVMTSHDRAFHGPKAFASGAEFHEAFMQREFGVLELTDEFTKTHFERNPRYDAIALLDKWRDDPANFMGWLALRRTAEPALDEETIVLRPRLKELERRIAGDGFVRLDLIGDTGDCGRDCDGLLHQYSDWTRTAFEGCVPVGAVAADATPVASGTELVAPAVPLALLEAPESLEAYHALIGPKSRNMIRKAQRAGYTFAPFEYNERLDDLFEVNTSKPVRQGQPMSAGYLERPKPISSHAGCDRHRIVWLGGFRNGRLRAYARLIVLEEIAIVSQFLGHGEDLHNGVMNGLVDEMAQFVIGDDRIRAINYLTLRSSTETLDRFKRSVGFRERVVVLTVLAV